MFGGGLWAALFEGGSHYYCMEEGRPTGYGITSPHRAIVGTLAINSTTLISRAAKIWNQDKFEAVAGKVMEIVDNIYMDNVSAEDLVGIVQRCIACATKTRRGPNARSIANKLFSDSRLQEIRQDLQRSTEPSEVSRLRQEQNSVARRVQEESFREFLDELIRKRNNPWAFWKALRLLDNQYYLKVRDSSLGREASIRASWLRNYTIDEGLLEKALSRPAPEYWTPEGPSTITVTLPTGENIKAILKRKPNPGTPGPDSITYHHLRSLGDAGYAVMAQTLGDIMESEDWPSIYKQALLKAIPKGDNECDYRPISLLPCLSKVHESYIAKLLKEDLGSRDIISDAQFGGRRNSSTEDVVSHNILDICHCLDHGEHVIVLYLDISKAFDRIYHPVLLEILRNYKFDERLIGLVDSYLKGRSYYIKSSGLVGESIEPDHGGPQGSVLLPLLWILYINPLVDTAHRRGQNIKAFVDDCQWVFKFKPEEGFPIEEIDGVLNFIEMFLTYLRLTVSGTKCKLLYIYGENKKLSKLPTIIGPWDGKQIEFVKQHKSLGVIFDNRFTFAPQGKKLIASARKRLIHLKRLVRLPTELMDHHLWSFWNNCFVAGFSYCLAWYIDLLAESTQRRITTLYNESIRIISYLPRGTYCGKVYAGRDVVTLADLLLLYQLRYIRRRLLHPRALVTVDLKRWLSLGHPLLVDPIDLMKRASSHGAWLHVLHNKEIDAVKVCWKLCRKELLRTYESEGRDMGHNPDGIVLRKELRRNCRRVVKWIFNFRANTLATPVWLEKRDLLDSPHCHFCTNDYADALHLYDVCRGRGLPSLRKELHLALVGVSEVENLVCDGYYYRSLAFLLNVKPRRPVDLTNALRIAASFPLLDYTRLRKNESRAVTSVP